MPTIDEIRTTIERLEAERSTAGAAAEALGPKLDDARTALGRAGLDHRLGSGSQKAVDAAGVAVRDLEREQAEHTSVIAEANRRLDLLRVELAAAEHQVLADRHAGAVRQRDRQVQIAVAKASDLAESLAELRRLHRAMQSAAHDAGADQQPRWWGRFAENMAHVLGLGYVQSRIRQDLAAFAAPVADEAEVPA